MNKSDFSNQSTTAHIHEMVKEFENFKFRFKLEEIGILSVQKLITESQQVALKTITLKYLSECTGKNFNELNEEFNQLFEQAFREKYADFVIRYGEPK